MNINELLILFSKYSWKHAGGRSKIELYSDGSGFLSPVEDYQPVIGFCGIEELVKLLEE